MDSILVLDDLKLVVCKFCRFAILPKGLDYHFQRIHKTELLERGKIQALIEEKDLIRDFKDLEISPSYRLFKELSLYSDGFGCSNCSFITRNITSISEHYRKNHLWINPRKAGRSSTKKIDYPWISNLQCQQFFRNPPKNQYFRILDPNLDVENERNREIAENRLISNQDQ
ncbi:MAG: hypothetical protein Q9190_008029, partial [Brigantiaea leucoxantha]